MREASAEEPYRCVYAGRDVSDEVTTSAIDVGAVAFEDDSGAVRMFVCNLNDAARAVRSSFAGDDRRRSLEAGALARGSSLAGAPGAERLPNPGSPVPAVEPPR